jgi:hypothetical protein
MAEHFVGVFRAFRKGLTQLEHYPLELVHRC